MKRELQEKVQKGPERKELEKIKKNFRWRMEEADSPVTSLWQNISKKTVD